MLLTKTRDAAAAARPRLRRLVGAKLPTMDRRAFLKRSGLVAGAGAFASQLPFNLIGKAEAAAEGSGASKIDSKRTVCTHCSVGLRGRRDRREWRVGASGAGVRFAAQSRRALRQGRVGARARHARALASAEDADEAGRRQVAADDLGPGHQRGRRPAARAAKRTRDPTRCSGSAAPSTTTSRRT